MADGSDPGTSLAAIAPGQTMVICGILFEGLRRICADLGLEEGVAVRCAATTAAHLFLRGPDGRVVRFERGWARFVQARPARPATLVSR